MKKEEIKSLLLFSLASGVVMGFLFFLVGALTLPDGSWLLALWAGVFSAVALFLVLFVVFLRAEKRFSKVRAGINTPILYEVDGFWQKENGKQIAVRVFLCQSGVVIASQDSKPPVVDILKREEISDFEFFPQGLLLYLADGRLYVFSIPFVDEIAAILLKEGWIGE